MDNFPVGLFFFRQFLPTFSKQKSGSEKACLIQTKTPNQTGKLLLGMFTCSAAIVQGILKTNQNKTAKGSCSDTKFIELICSQDSGLPECSYGGLWATDYGIGWCSDIPVF